MRPIRDNGRVVGGKSPMSDAEARLYTNTVLDTIAKRSGADVEPLQVVTIQSATKQVVAGALYEIKVRVLDKATGVEQDCEFSIWSRLWLPDGTEVTSKCNGLPNDKFTISEPAAAGDEAQANRQ